MFTNKKTLKTFGILVITLVGLLAIQRAASYGLEIAKEPYREKLEELMSRDIKAGKDINLAMQEALKNNPEILHKYGKEYNDKGKYIAIASIVAAIILLYFSSVAVTYFTREEKT